MNSVGNVYCDKCNARLVPMATLPPEEPESEPAPIKGLSLPTIPLEEEREPQVEGMTEEARAGGEAVGDWLAQIRASTEEEAEEPKEPEIAADVEPAEVPDWLSEMRPPEAAPPAAVPLVAASAPAPAEVPDWLRKMRPPEESPPAAVPSVAAPAPVPAEVPDWLSEMRPPEAAPPAAVPPVAAPAPVPAEVPDWLSEMRPPEAAPPAAVPPVAASAPAPAEVPDWLSEMRPPEAAPPAAVPLVAEPAPVPAEVPDWLSEMRPPEAAPPAAVPPVVASAPVPAEVPDWLSEMRPPEAAPPAAPPLVAEPAPAPAEVPDWLREMAPPEAAPEVEITEAPEWLAELEAKPILPSAAVVSAFEGVTSPRPPEPGIGVTEPVVSLAEPPVVSLAEPGGGLVQAEIPDWLQAMRPRPKMTEAVIEEEPVETEGPLQGLRSLLPPALSIETPAVSERRKILRLSLPTEISEASLARAQLLQSVLAQPAQAPRPEERKQGISMGERAQRWLVAVVLLVAVLGILIPPLMGFDVPTLTQPATFPAAIGRIEFQHVMNLHTAIQNTNTGDVVLVAFEYGPPEADELDLVAEPILHHLLDQGAHISVVSTQPEGLAVAAGLLSDIAAPEEQYTLASYRPGDATAVSSLLTGADIPPWGGGEGGTHPELIVVLTARPAPLRWWVEQTRALGDAPPVVAGVSASLQIAASPYLDANAGQLEGAIIGLSGAAAYETHRGLGGWATQRINGLAAGHMAIVGLMVLGAIICTFGGSRGSAEPVLSPSTLLRVNSAEGLTTGGRKK